jgi:L,D-transpeptidase catalytic domain
VKGINRRGFVAGTLALPFVTSAAHAAPADAALVAIANRELGRLGSKIWLKDLVGIADFSLPSSVPRFFLVDIMSSKVRRFLVSHGRGSDPEHLGMLQTFSNENGSGATSRGAYITLKWYDGIHGPSMRLQGLDADNSNAIDRAIVIHSAPYANPEMIQTWGKLGRSDGCFVFPETNLMEILARLSPGRLLFADRL